MKFFQTSKINTSDYPEEQQETISRFSELYNPLIDSLDQILNGGIDFDNLDQRMFQIQVVVDADGVPIRGNQVRLTAKPQPIGMTVVRTQGAIPTTQPHIIYEPAGNGLINFTNIRGLEPNVTYNLTVIAF